VLAHFGMQSVEPKRILCAVDFSECSHRALHVATEAARKSQAVLVLLHVEDRPLSRSKPYVDLPGDSRQEQLVRAETQLASWKQEAQRRGATEVITKLASGAPWDRIVALARTDTKIDLVVLGTRGRTGLAHAPLGSVAERVMRHAPCSVMVVRQPAEEAADHQTSFGHP
jgi:nucleotide-binding universal stress UspA family protein